MKIPKCIEFREIRERLNEARSRMISILAILGVSFLSAQAHAVEVTWEASGTIDQSNNSYGIVPIQVAVGDQFTVTYSFDTSAVGGCGVQTCTYAGIENLTITDGSQHYSIAMPSVAFTTIEADAPHTNSYATTYAVYESTAPVPAGQAGTQEGADLDFSISSPTPLGLFASAALPTSPPSPSDFPDPVFSYSIGQFNAAGTEIAGGVFSGSVTSLSAVPEPTSVWLLLAGGVCMLVAIKHRSSLSSSVGPFPRPRRLLPTR